MTLKTLDRVVNRVDYSGGHARLISYWSFGADVKYGFNRYHRSVNWLTRNVDRMIPGFWWYR